MERGTPVAIEHDGFRGVVIGHYERLDGKRGVVLQQDGTKVVHVYGEKWVRPADDLESCLACNEPMKAGDKYLWDVSGDPIHAGCAGPERESYTKGDGEPLGPDDPIPTPLTWQDAPNPSPAAKSGEARAGIYTASKTKHAPVWQDYRARGWPINSTWIDEAGPGESADLSDLWDRCIREASTASVLVVYREADDVLKGGWAEVGAALACGVPIYAVGIEGFTIAKDRRIEHFETLDDAMDAAARLAAFSARFQAVCDTPEYRALEAMCSPALATPSPQPADALREALETYYARQIEWSRATFGPALRTGGVIDHIRKELREIEAQPHDLSEWVDVIILAMDGYWRHGGTAESLMPSLLAKQAKNMARNWPDWRTMSEDSAIEHDRSGEPAALTEPAPAGEAVEPEGAERRTMEFLVARFGGHGVTIVRDGERLIGYSLGRRGTIAMRDLLAAVPFASKEYGAE
ncbi:dATP/dGTP pyrophosphohydrolase domain-containing protein [Aureimonas sp. AU40]|uniref:dATP/dGTP pyrophosphohydrolase domain-containing protein n=1 Tax=Aureimonas sp. AU40 TaxID=1637747 RepID=UPI001FCDA7FC|nr:dATP/dGTP pyrophosphohydrolase domain-containing protein [Aureimonas sp. AU40]